METACEERFNTYVTARKNTAQSSHAHTSSYVVRRPTHNVLSVGDIRDANSDSAELEFGRDFSETVALCEGAPRKGAGNGRAKSGGRGYL